LDDGDGAALVGWIAVIGAAREYARFTAAGIPAPAETASLFPRGALLGEGLIALLLPLLVGITAAIITYVALRLVSTKRASWQSASVTPQRLTRRRTALVAVAATTFAGGIAILLILGFIPSVVPLILITPVVCGVVMLGWIKTPWAASVRVFLALAIEAGISEYWSVATNNRPSFVSAIVVRRGGRQPVAGFYLTRSGGNVYIAVRPEAHSSDRQQFAVESIPDDEVDAIVLGPQYHLTDGNVSSGTQAKLPTTTVPTPQGSNIKPLVPPKPQTPTTLSPSSGAPAIRLFAVDELIPSHGQLSFPIGGGQVRETVDVSIVAQLPGHPLLLNQAGLRLNPGERVALTVQLPPAVQDALAHNAFVHIDVAASATAAGKGAWAYYSLYLQQPCYPVAGRVQCSKEQ
jgi:hypothetical protein